jgi:polyisoprenoid-binding protein YceI
MSIQRRTLALVAAVCLFPALVRAADTYKLDPVHCSAAFRVKHLNVSYIYGLIDKPEGTIVVDDADPSKTTFDIPLKAANLNTGEPKRNEHLKSPDFFSAQEFPTLSFKSTAVKSAGDNKIEVTGDIMIHGQTKSITVTLEKIGAAKTPMGDRCGYAGEFTIKRSEFGMSKMLEAVSDEVTIMVGLEGKK